MTIVDIHGQPVSSLPLGIPVIQQVANPTANSSGGVAIRFIRRPPNIEAAADLFVAQGGCYRVAARPNGRLHFAATMGEGADIYQLSGEESPNGPEHLDAVDRVVLASVKHIGTVM